MLINFLNWIVWPAIGGSCLSFLLFVYSDLPAFRTHPERTALVFFAISNLIYIAIYFFYREKKINTEIKALQTQLKQSEALAAVGYLSAGVAHELKNPMNFILNFSELSLELLREQNAQPSSTPWCNELILNIQTILNHANRANSIMQNILLYANPAHQPQKQPTDLNQLLEECFQLSFHAQKNHHPLFNVKIIKNFDDQIGEILLYKEEMGRAFINLISNALDALHEKKQQTPDFMPMLELKTTRSEHTIQIHIQDNGPGIPVENLQKIFQPFYSTKTAHTGTGLGLAITQDVIKRHGGTLEVFSQPHQLTDFLLTIPIEEGTR